MPGHLLHLFSVFVAGQGHLSLHLKTYFSLSVCIYAAGRCKRDSSLVPFSAHFALLISWNTFLCCKRCSKPAQTSKPLYPRLISSFLVSPRILVLISSVSSGSSSVSCQYTWCGFYHLFLHLPILSILQIFKSRSTPGGRCDKVSISTKTTITTIVPSSLNLC